MAQSLNKYQQLQKPPKQTDFEKLAAVIEESVQQKTRRIVVRYGQNIEAISLDQAAYFYTQQKVVFMQTHQGKRYPV